VTLSPGDLIDQKYRIVRLLGKGGMGSVYAAENIRVDRRVAIKVMHQARSPQDIARFEREARAAQIGSPHIVQVFDLGYLAATAPYMVMEYLAGETLGERLQRVRRLQAFELLPIARQILDGLGAAHRAGIIHRDLKPDNVFLARIEADESEVVKLLDFGISKFTDAARKASEVSLTRSGVAVGTPHYMSPEQVQGSKELDIRTDLYSLGVIFYRCLSGQLPFQSEDVAPLLVQILLEEPTPLHEVCPDIDRELSALIARSMARRAEDRFQTAGEFRAALAQWEQTHSGLAAPLPLPAHTDVLTSDRVNQPRTSASWSTAAAKLPDPKRAARYLVLAMLSCSAALVATLYAHKHWPRHQPQAVPLLATESSPEPAISGPAPATSAVATNAIDVDSTSSAPSDLAPAASPSDTVQTMASTGRGPTLSPPVSPGPAPSTTIGKQAPIPAKAALSPETEQDNRHMSRGVH
jgi:eukaryotic-like serine/threonine-protein kinase